ncbi:hypothetical protein BH11BAC6_BH11BAC6_00550 [soil metagenome]
MKIQGSVKTISKTLMISTIILIAAFQFYWINRLYNDEWQNLKRENDVLFRDVVYKLQLQRFRSDTAFFKKGLPDNLFLFDVMDSVKENVIDSAMRTHVNGKERQLMISVTRDKHSVDTMNEAVTITTHADSFNMPFPSDIGPTRVIKYFSNNKNINDSLRVSVIDSAYKSELLKNGITLSFTVKAISGKAKELADTIKPDQLKTNFTFVGLSKTYAYQAAFNNPLNYILGKIKFPILFSILLITITILSFVFLYRNMLAQRRLSEIKNEFISNITHELKTPIATVTVAIEALKNFNALQSPEKTKEYLDISAAELQRLSLLVDKVLRFSMFENQNVELKKEGFDLYELVKEVSATMKLQFEKQKADIKLTKQGAQFIIEADRLHITSVIYNLLDNALKYSKEVPSVEVEVISHETFIEFRVKDKGIGIAKEYKQKIFEKFFRVPGDSHHNIKGYGLGLSYVSHIARRHMGFIEVESELNNGSVFSVKLPYKESPLIEYDRGRVIRKM